ncbi:MAG TPA: hypothetical protein VIV40_14210 [Kofleriaceae bacterium]
MRVCIGLVVIASLGCSKKADSPAKAGSALAVAGDAAPGSAAAAVADAALDSPVAAVADAGPALPKFCITDDEADRGLRILKKDDASIAFCFTEDDVAKKCAVVELASGAFTAIAPPPPAPEAKPPATDTSKLALPKGHTWETALSPDGKTIAAVSDLEGQLFIVDAASGKVRKVVKWSADGGCMEQPSFIGDNIYVQYNVCAGPGATGWIVSPEGKKLGGIKHVNPTGDFYPIGGTRYAFEDFGGSGLEIVDGKTGKSLKEIEIKLPEDCHDNHECLSLATGNLGLVQLPNGKLVQLMGQIAIVDAAAGKIDKMIKWPLCPEAK